MLLINSSSQDSVKIFQTFYPIHPPVGIGYLLSAAEKKGIPVRHIDEQVEKDVVGKVAEYIKSMEPPYIFGFSVLTAAFKNAILVSQELRTRYPEAFIVFGGVHPTLAPEEVLAYPHIDAVIRNEAEESLIELYGNIKEGKDFTHIQGLSYRKGGKIVHNDNRPVQPNLDMYPLFPYHLFNHPRYDLGFVMSSRGCPYKCIFCAVSAMPDGRRYRYRSAEAIVAELEMLCHKYHAHEIIFVDDNFLVNPKRIYALIELIMKKELHKKMSFSFQARGDGVEYTLCKAMYNAGFMSVLFGLETASEKIMNTIKKGETVAQNIEAVNIMKDIGFTVGATFVYALPGETHEDRMDCVKLSKRLQIDVVRFNNAIPYPGTELYELAKKENRLNIQGMYENFIAVSGIVESPFKKIPFAYVPKGSSENEIRRDILLSHFSIYCRILKTLNILFKPAHSTKWFNIGDNLIDIFKKIPAFLYLGMLLFCKFGQFLYYALIKRETVLPFRYVLQLLFTDGVKKRNGYTNGRNTKN